MQSGTRQRALVLLATILLLGHSMPLLAQTPITAGFRDFSFGTTAISTPTGEKPESKLWFADGTWWGCLFSESANRYRIFRFNTSTQSWTDTGTSVDTRTNSKADVLWDEASDRLYVVSHVFTTNGRATTTTSQWGRLFRYSYNRGQQQYSLDAGFPVNVTRGLSETLTVARDASLRTWVTFVEGGKVKINWSSDDVTWGVPVDLPLGSTDITVTTDDISGIIALADGNIGVMWSNQLTNKTLFAVHRFGDAPTAWQPVETVLPNGACPSGACADDHVNMKVDSLGRVFAAVKTSLSTSTQPLVMLAVRSTAGTWSAYTVGLQRDHHTRPIVALDEQHGRVYVFATSPENDGAIYMKSSDVNAISFSSGIGQAFIKSATELNINNATSTKQNVNSTSGLLVAATDGVNRFYFHNFLPLGGAPPPTRPADPTGLGATAASSTRVDLSWTDASDNEDRFHIERAPGGTTTFAEIGTVNANVKTFSDVSVVASTAYSYRVRASNAAGFSGYSNTANVTTPAASTSQPIKNITFEDGSLTHPATGADRVNGTVSLVTAGTLKGAFSAHVPNTASSYLEESFTAADDFYTSFYVRVNALPAISVRLVLVSNAGTTVGNILLMPNGKLRLRNSTTVVGADSAALTVGQLYRVGFHQQRGTGTNGVLQAFLAAGDANFSAPFASTSAGAWTTAADRLRIGATGADGGDLDLDDIRLDAAAMPGPSAGGGSGTVPDAPTNLNATAASSSRVDLSWTDASDNEDHFHIERAPGGTATFAEIATVNANDTTFSDLTVAAATSYSYRVRSSNAVGFSAVYSNTASVTTPPATSSQRIKDITFEGGSLTDAATGVDRVNGTVSLESAAPLKGSFAARIPNAASSYLEESFTAADDIFISAYLRLEALPAVNVRLVLVTNGGTIVGNILVLTNGKLRLRNGTTVIGADSPTLTVGQLYRIGFRQKRGTGANGGLEAYLAAGDAPFSSPFAATAAGAWTTAADRLRLGATGVDGGDMVVDDIRLDAASMPGPSQ